MAAGAAAAIPAVSNANIIYTDENPDFNGVIGSQYFLDLNNDGNDDFRIWHNGASNLYISPLTASNEALGSGGVTFAYPFALTSGAMISSGAGQFFNNGYAGGFQSLNYGSCSFGNWCSVTDRYIGVRFSIGGNIHYGWVRLDVNQAGSVWTVKDYAYEDIMGNGIAAGAMGNPGTASTASGVTGVDIADNGNGLDLEVSFNQGTDETTINEYRIMVVKSVNAGAFDLTAANAVVPANYTTVAPSGGGVYTQTVGAGALDVDGDAVTNSQPYVIFIHSEADGVNATTNSLSSGSPEVTLEIPVDTASNVMAADIGDLGGGQDLEVTFDAATNENTLSEYRIMVVKSANVGAFDETAAAAVGATDYTVVNTGGGPTYQQTLAAVANDVDGDQIANGQPYRVFIYNVADGINATQSLLTSPSNEVTLLRAADPASNISGMDVADNNNGSDLQVSFDRAVDETTIGEYRVMVVPTSSANMFNLTVANSLNAPRYYVINPVGTATYTFTIDPTTETIFGNTVYSGNDYSIFVLCVADGVFANLNTLSGPSASVSLDVEVDGATSVSAADQANWGDGRDLKVVFDGAASENGITEYRMITVKTANAASFDLNAAEAAIYYKPVTPTGASVYNNNFDNTSRDVDGDMIVENVPYKVFVLAKADGVIATLSDLSLESNEVTLGQNVGVNEQANSKPSIFANDGQIIIDGAYSNQSEPITVIDLTGNVVYEGFRTQSRTEIKLDKAMGIYLVRLTVGDDVMTRKVVLR